jgi:RNA-directed DNA polymerase
MIQMRQIGKLMQTSLRGIANKARCDSRHRFRNLYGLLNEEALETTWKSLNKRAASGVDHVKAGTYAQDLEENLTDLAARLRQKRYKAKLVRRKHIPKDGTGTRPLGIPVLEDRLVQLTGARVLEAIYEPEFLPCSYAYRNGRGAGQAVRELTLELQFRGYGYVVDIDIKGFFDNIDHDLLMEILAERIDDKPFLRLIRKWLKAGVLEEDGKVVRPDTGCPQGGCISPILANIYLHHVLDKWFEREVKPRCRGRAYMNRYADDIVFAFQLQYDADRFYKVLPKRLDRYGLEMSTAKSRKLRFSRFKLGPQAQSFDYLGFEFRWMPDRKGVPRVKRRTSRKRLRRALARTTKWIQKQRHRPVREIMRSLDRKLRGYYNYYGVRGNSKSLWEFYREVLKIVRKWLNRRSQSRSYWWRGFHAMIRYFKVARPRITEYGRCRQQGLFADAF